MTVFRSAVRSTCYIRIIINAYKLVSWCFMALSAQKGYIMPKK